MKNRTVGRFFLSTLAVGLASADRDGLFTRHRALTRVEQGDRDGIMHVGNFAEPRELDPQLSIGIPETDILYSLGEGLVTADQHDLHPTPGVAESWEISSDQLTYTFHLRADAQWSNGAPLTAPDFVASYRRILDPDFGAELSFYVWPLKNAEAYNKKKITDFDQVGVHAPDAHTLRLDLEHPTPYLLRLVLQRMWFPVYLPAIEKTGALDDRSNQGWTRPGNYVCNGPFVLTDWQPNQQIVVKKNPTTGTPRTSGSTRCASTPSATATPRKTISAPGSCTRPTATTCPPPSSTSTSREHPELFHNDPYLGIYFYHVQHDQAAARRRARAPCAGHEHRPREPRQKRAARRSAARGKLHPAGYRRLHQPRADSLRPRRGQETPRRRRTPRRPGSAAAGNHVQHQRAAPAGGRGRPADVAKANSA